MLNHMFWFYSWFTFIHLFSLLWRTKHISLRHIFSNLNCIYLGEEICRQFVSLNNFISVCIMRLNMCCTSILCLAYGFQMVRYVLIVVLMLIVVEYVAHVVDDVDMYYEIDLITVYLFIWQLTALVLQWM
jgi:hypothetical protein